MSDAYRDAGVDIKAGREAVERMKSHVEKTLRPEVIGGLGGFGSLFALDTTAMKAPVLVSGTDGVGTKLKLAFATNRHDTIGIDCVAMVVNDIAAQGAEPLFFLDYFATGRLEPQVVEEVVKGLASGCLMAGCALVGGETAEMPDMYAPGEYDIAGFAVGIVDREKLLDGAKAKEGDLLLALPSSGVHSNGFSLVRKLFFRDRDYDVQTTLDEIAQKEGLKLPEVDKIGTLTLGELLLEPTKIYVNDLRQLREAGVEIQGLAHITGGGLDENLPRAFSKTLQAQVSRSALAMPWIFSWLQHLGALTEDEMVCTFNCGVGMVVILRPEDVEEARRVLPDASLLGVLREKPVGEKTPNFLLVDELPEIPVGVKSNGAGQ